MSSESICEIAIDNVANNFIDVSGEQESFDDFWKVLFPWQNFGW